MPRGIIKKVIMLGMGIALNRIRASLHPSSPILGKKIVCKKKLWELQKINLDREGGGSKYFRISWSVQSSTNVNYVRRSSKKKSLYGLFIILLKCFYTVTKKNS